MGRAAETREIDHQHCMLGAAFGADRVLKFVGKARAVGQAGEAVGRHLAAQALLGAQLGGLVDKSDHASRSAAVDRAAGEHHAEVATIDFAAELPGGLLMRLV